MKKICLIRYDVECDWREDMGEFLKKTVQVHRELCIPATFFFTGKFLEANEAAVKKAFLKGEDEELFDLQCHSYSHVCLGYEDAGPLELLKADYERAFLAHERVFGRKPMAVSLCGKEGKRLEGFDSSAEARAEFEMLAGLGIKMVNTFLKDCDEAAQFINYNCLGRPDIMGFPSGNSDTGWFLGKSWPQALKCISGVIEGSARREEHLPFIFHDWAAWEHAPDKELSHVRAIAAETLERGYTFLNIRQCYRMMSTL